MEHRRPIPPVLMFDFDGTLVDSREAITSSVLKALDEFGLPPLPLAVIAGNIGLPAPVALARALPDVDADTVTRLVACYRHHYATHGQFQHAPFAGVNDLLPALKAKGYRLTIATAKPSAPLADLMDRYGWNELFEARRGGDDVVNSKPAPDMLFSLIDQLGVVANDCMMIGDSIYDIQMGKSAGVATCAVTWGYNSQEALAQAAPDFTHSSVDSMAAWLLAD
ncbi:MAG: HAD family hydrolase [Holosporaceae bacterium]|jgi:phosphoglycolate phosphatase|nr:HAD family hydrolase [Rhodospirillaceae bacterium]